MAGMTSPNDRLDDNGILPEDRVRAEIYAVLGNLFYHPPSKSMLNVIANGCGICNDDAAGLCRAWQALRQAAAVARAEEVKDEFDAAFIGTGRQPVMLYASFYLTGFLNERPLAQLRDELAKMGLARGAGAHETEDHVSALCDAMRFLIAGNDGVPPAALDAQRSFFRRYIKPCYAQLCDAVAKAAETRFYKHVADFARAFFEVEDQAFDIT